MCNISGFRNVAQYDATTGGGLAESVNARMKHQTSNFKPQTCLENDFEKLDLVVFPGERIISQAIEAGSILGWSFRIQHLQRIAAPNGARDYTLGFFLVQWGHFFGFG